MNWEQIIKDPEFQTQPGDIKQKVAENYFAKNIAIDDFQQQTEEIRNQVYNNFMSTVTPIQQPDDVTAQAPEMSFGERVGRGVARGTLGTLALIANLPSYSVIPALRKEPFFRIPKTMAEAKTPFAKRIVEQTQVPEPEKFLSKETLADFIGTGIADLPLIIGTSGLSGIFTKGLSKKIVTQALKKGMKSLKLIKTIEKSAKGTEFIAREALAGGLFAQTRQYDNPQDRLKQTAIESAAWVSFGIGSKAIGLTYRNTLGKLFRKVLNNKETANASVFVNEINKAIADNDEQLAKQGINKLNTFLKDKETKSWEKTVTDFKGKIGEVEKKVIPEIPKITKEQIAKADKAGKIKEIKPEVPKPKTFKTIDDLNDWFTKLPEQERIKNTNYYKSEFDRIIKAQETLIKETVAKENAAIKFAEKPAEIKVEPAKITKPILKKALTKEYPTSWIDLVRKSGGIKPTKKYENIPLAVKKKDGYDIAEMADILQKEGHLEVPSNKNAVDVLYEKIISGEKFQKVKYEKPTKEMQALSLKGAKTIFYEDLKKGDSFTIKGENFKVTQKTPDKAVITDGKTYELEPGFSPLDIDKGSLGKKPLEKPIPTTKLEEKPKLHIEPTEAGPQVSFKPPATMPTGKKKLTPGQKRLTGQEGGLFEIAKPKGKQEGLFGVKGVTPIGAIAGFEKDKEGKWRYNVSRGITGTLGGIAIVGIMSSRKQAVSLLAKELGNEIRKKGGYEFQKYVTARGFDIKKLTDIQAKILLNDLKRGISPESIKKASLQLGKKAIELEGTQKVLTGKAAQVEQMYRQTDIELKELKKFKVKRLYQKLKTATVDMSANVKKALLKEGGDLGREVVIRKDLVRGANTKAKEIINNNYKTIYSGLSKEEEKILNRVIQSRRTITIEQYKDIKHPFGLTKEHHQEYLNNLPKEIFTKLNIKANSYFKTMQEQLDDLYKNGLISKESYQALLSRGDYSPRHFIQHIDPYDPMASQYGKISVGNSGLKSLTTGSERILENNSRLLLAEVIGRTQSRIFKNNANKALYKLAKDFPDNKVIQLFDGKKVPAEYEKITAMIKGQPVKMVMPKSLAKEWIVTDPAINSQLSNIIGWLSGTKILKPMATGLNPEFALTNFPRDIAHVWLTTGEYSATIPKFLLQMGKDLATVSLDTIKRGKRWKDFIAEGGGMDFLTHQGAITRKVTGVFGQIQKIMGYLGETSEIWTRLALRERALINKKLPHEATWIARNYIDFSQGGWFIKAADTAIPYLNAGVQGTRGIFRAAVAKPLTFTYKVAQLGAMATGIYLANKTQNPEALAAISDRDKINNFIITTPFSYLDKSGNKRYIYFKIAKDQGQRIISTIFESLTKKFMGENVDIDIVTKAAQEFIPYIPTQNVPPSFDAMMGYYANKDFWKNEDIWKGTKVIPSEEYTNYTPEAYIGLGKITGLSPEKTKYALEQYFTYGNIWTSLVGGSLNQIVKQLPHAEREKTKQEILTQLPFIRRFAKSTYPYTQQQKYIDNEKIKSSTENYKRTRKLDELAYQYYKSKLNADKQKVREFIKLQPQENRKSLLSRFKRNAKFYNIPDRRWWIDLSYLNPETRAVVYYTRWSQSNQSEKNKLEDYLKTLPGIKTTRFKRKLLKLKGVSK